MKSRDANCSKFRCFTLNGGHLSCMQHRCFIHVHILQQNKQDQQSPIQDGFNDTKDNRRRGHLSTACRRIRSACKTFFAFRGGINADDDEELYYQDNYNDFSWKCSFGTREDDGIWMNRKDQVGTIMSFLVWILISKSDDHV